LNPNNPKLHETSIVYMTCSIHTELKSDKCCPAGGKYLHHFVFHFNFRQKEAIIFSTNI